MKITDAEIIPLSIPFDDHGSGESLMPGDWSALDYALVRLTDETGAEGWGDGWCFYCQTPVLAAMRDMVQAHVLGAEVEPTPDGIRQFMRGVQQRLHLFGRYGITMFAISGFDMALWDLAAKRAGLSLAAFLGGAQRAEVEAYASLVRYGDPAKVEEITARAVAEGYGAIKLHEITLPAIEAGRRAAPGLKLSTDVNCNWSADDMARLGPEMARLELHWLEEPLFPPDDEAALGEVERAYGVPVASGENACTAVEFRRTAPHIAMLQPSVGKVGGVTEFDAVCRDVSGLGKRVMPHSPYFGPGYWATLQLMAAHPVCEMFEVLYIEPVAEIGLDRPQPTGGRITIPDAPGLGFTPDPETLTRYRV